MNRLFIAGIVIAGTLFFCGETVYAGRPLSTDDAGTVAPGHLEVELGGEYVNVTGNEDEYAFSAVFTTGILENLDIGLELPYIWLDYDSSKEHGFGDLQAIVKFRFHDETNVMPALAVTAGIKTCTGDCQKGLGTGETDFVANCIASKSFGLWTLHINLGYNYTGDPAEEKAADFINCSLAAEYAVSETFALVGEIVGEFATEDTDEDNPAEILIGAVYEVPCGIAFDCGVAFGLTDATADTRITLGLTYTF